MPPAALVFECRRSRWRLNDPLLCVSSPQWSSEAILVFRKKHTLPKLKHNKVHSSATEKVLKKIIGKKQSTCKLTLAVFNCLKKCSLSAIKTSVVWRERRRIEPLTHESLAESAMRTERRADAHRHKRATVAAAWKRRLAQRPSQRGEIEGSIQKVGFRCKILISMLRRYRMLVHLLQEQWLTNSWMRGHG